MTFRSLLLLKTPQLTWLQLNTAQWRSGKLYISVNKITRMLLRWKANLEAGMYTIWIFQQ